MQTILLITTLTSAPSFADAIRQELDLGVHVAPSRKAALAALRLSEFSLILIEESLAVSDPEGADLIYGHAGTAPVLELNFAISSTPRVLRQVRSALNRRMHDQAAARAAAATELQNELNASLAGLLLESQLALREATPEQAPKLQHVVELAGDLRDLLRG